MEETGEKKRKKLKTVKANFSFFFSLFIFTLDFIVNGMKKICLRNCFDYYFFKIFFQACEAQHRNSHYRCDENGDLKCLTGEFDF